MLDELTFERRRDGYWLKEEADVKTLAQAFKKAGGRLCTISALPLADGEVELLYHFDLKGALYTVRARTRGKTAPSISGITKAAMWIEREIHDLFAVKFSGHPCLESLILPQHLERGLYMLQAQSE